MYFAVESLDPALWLDGLLQTVLGAPQVHWFALVDGAFDQDGVPFVSPAGHVPLYGRANTLHDLLPAPPLSGSAGSPHRRRLARHGDRAGHALPGAAHAELSRLVEIRR